MPRARGGAGPGPQPGSVDHVAVPTEITCIDCGGPCTLLNEAPEDGWHLGDRLVFRCRDCLDRWDLVVEEDDLLP